MDRSMLGALAAIAAVAIVGLLMRRAAGGDASEKGVLPTGLGDETPLRGASDAADDAERAVADGVADADASDDEAEPDDAAEVDLEVGDYGATTEGSVLSYDGREVRLGRSVGWAPGDLAGVRVFLTDANDTESLLEVIDREGLYDVFAFPERDGADHAVELLRAARIVRPRTLEDGTRLDSSDACFERAIAAWEAANPVEPEADPDAPVEELTLEAVSAGGEALVEGIDGVRVLPPPEPGSAWIRGATIERELGRRSRERRMRPGLYVGARVAGGAAPDEPWRVELLGSDGEWASIDLAGREDADAALALLRRCEVVQPRLDDAGNEIEVTADQFDEAHRIVLETEADLSAATSEPDESSETATS